MQDNNKDISHGDEATATGYPSTTLAAPRLTESPGTSTSWPKSTKAPVKDTEDNNTTTADHHIHIGSQTLSRQSRGLPGPTPAATADTTTRRSRNSRIGGGARFPANGFRPIVSRDTYYRDRDHGPHSDRGGHCATRSGSSSSSTIATVPRREVIDGVRNEHAAEERGLKPGSPLAAPCDRVVQDRLEEGPTSAVFSAAEESVRGLAESTRKGKRRSTRKVPVQPTATTEGDGCCYGSHGETKGRWAGATVAAINGSNGFFTPSSHSSCIPSLHRGNNLRSINDRRERCRPRREQPPDNYGDLLTSNSITSRITSEEVPERQPRWTADHDPEPGTGFTSPSAASTKSLLSRYARESPTFTPEHDRKGRRRRRLDRDSELNADSIKEGHSPKHGLVGRSTNRRIAVLSAQGVRAERGRVGYDAASSSDPRGAFDNVDGPRHESESAESVRSTPRQDWRKARPEWKATSEEKRLRNEREVELAKKVRDEAQETLAVERDKADEWIREFHDALVRAREEASACRAKANALQRQLDRTDPSRFQGVAISLASEKAAAQSRVTDLKARLACVTSEYRRRARACRKAEAAAAERIAVAEARAAEAESRVEEATRKLNRSEHYLREAEECAVVAVAAVQRARTGTHRSRGWHFDASDVEPSDRASEAKCGSSDVEMFPITARVFPERLRGQRLVRQQDGDDDGVASVSMASRRGAKRGSTRQPHTVGCLDHGQWIDEERQRQPVLRGGENMRQRAEGGQGEQSDCRAETDAMCHTKDVGALLTPPRKSSTRRQEAYVRGNAYASSTTVVAPLGENEAVDRRAADAEREATRLRIALDRATEEAMKAADEAAQDREQAMVESERLFRELADMDKEMRVLRAALEYEKRRHEASRERVESRLEALALAFDEESSCGAKAALVALLDEKSEVEERASCFERSAKEIRMNLENRLGEALRAAHKAEAHADFLHAELDRQRLLCARGENPPNVVAVEDVSEDHHPSLAIGVASSAGATAAAEGGMGGCVEALRRGGGIASMDFDRSVTADNLRAREDHEHSTQTRRAGGVGLHHRKRTQEGNLLDNAKSKNASSMENLEGMPRYPPNIAEKIPMTFPPASIFDDFTSASQRMEVYKGEAMVASPQEECPRETLWGRGGVGAKETGDTAEAATTDRRESYCLTEHEVSGRVTTAPAETPRRYDIHGSRETASARNAKKNEVSSVPGEEEILRIPSVEGFGRDRDLDGSQAADERSTNIEPITAEKTVGPRAVVAESERHRALLQERAGTTRLEVLRQVFAQEREEEEEETTNKKTQESRVVVATLLDKKLRAEVGCPSEKHDATRFRPYFERRIIGVKSISSPRYLQSDIYIHRPQDATIHAQTEAVPVSAAKSEDPTLPEAAEGSTKAPAAVQEVMEQHAEAKQGLRDARISLLAPRGEAKQLRRRELEASQITRDCASKGFVDCLAQGRIAEVERTSKHAQQEQERSLARTETRLEVFTEAFERKELETQDQTVLECLFHDNLETEERISDLEGRPFDRAGGTTIATSPEGRGIVAIVDHNRQDSESTPTTKCAGVARSPPTAVSPSDRKTADDDDRCGVTEEAAGAGAGAAGAVRYQEFVDEVNKVSDEAKDGVSRHGFQLGTTRAARAVAIEDDVARRQGASVPKRIVEVEGTAEKAEGNPDEVMRKIESRLEVLRTNIRQDEDEKEEEEEDDQRVQVLERAPEDREMARTVASKEKCISASKCAIREGTGEHERSRMRAEAGECGEARVDGEGEVEVKSQLLLDPKEKRRVAEITVESVTGEMERLREEITGKREAASEAEPLSGDVHRAREVDASARASLAAEEGRKLAGERIAELKDGLKRVEAERERICLRVKARSGELSKAFEEEREESKMQTALTALLGEKLKTEERVAEVECELEAALAAARCAESAAVTSPRAELEVAKSDCATESMVRVAVEEMSDADASQATCPLLPLIDQQLTEKEAADRIAQLEAELTAARNDLEAAQKEIETLRGELERAHAEKWSAVEASEADHRATRERLTGLESLLEKADREHALTREQAEGKLQRFRSAVNEEGELFKTALAALLEEKIQAENSVADFDQATTNTRSTQLEEKSCAASEGRRVATKISAGRDPDRASAEERGWNVHAAVQTAASPREGRMPGVEHVAGWLTLEEEREIEARVEVTRAAVMASAASAIDDVTAARSKLVALQSAMEESERESLESRERAKRRHEALRQALEEEERENGVQAALTCLLYERDQAQARVAELEEQLAEARDTIRDGFAEVEASRADSNRNGKASLDAETRPSSVVPDTMRSDVKTENNLRSLRTRRRGAGGGELGAVGPVRGAAPRPHALLMADNASVDLGDRSLTDGVEDECFENCRVSPLSGLDLRVGDADDVSATVNHRGSKGGIVRDENAILLRPGQAETRLEGLKAPIPEKEEEAGTQEPSPGRDRHGTGEAAEEMQRRGRRLTIADDDAQDAPSPSSNRDETVESPRGTVARKKIIGHAHHHDSRSSGFWSALRSSGRKTLNKAKERLRSKSPSSRG